jgi:hypothetical protein
MFILFSSHFACMCHGAVLFLIHSSHLMVQNKVCTFASNCLSSTNNHVRFIAYNARTSVLSYFGRNIVSVGLMYSSNCISVASPLVPVICELVFCREGLFYNALSLDEINFLLRDICCV